MEKKYLEDSERVVQTSNDIRMTTFNISITHEGLDESYVSLTQVNHPQIFEDLVSKAKSSYTGIAMSLTCLASLESSDGDSSPEVKLTTYLDSGSSLNLICSSVLLHLKHRKLKPMKLRISGINQTSELKLFQRVQILFCKGTRFETHGNCFVVDKIGIQSPHLKQDLENIKNHLILHQ